MSDNQRVNEGHQPTAVTGGGHPEQISKGWVPDSVSRGHQPTASMAEPTVGPSTPSGSSSANVSTPPPPASPADD
jgi:hypothetical protein